MARVAFIGIGTMGSRMARHLIAAGHEVIACDIEPERAAALAAATARTPAEAAADAEVVITSLPSPQIVEEVVLGSDGFASAAPRSATAIEMSTSPPSLARRLAAQLEERGIEFLDAPVSGGPTGAEAGTLAIMVGGKREVFERWRSLLEVLGELVVHVGDTGAGQTVKLCNNLIVATEMVAIAEGCAILEREGIDPSVAFKVLTSSTSDSRVMRVRFPLPGVRPEHPSSKDFSPMFTLDLLHKDLTLGLELAREDGVDVHLAAKALEAYEAARKAGLGALDYSAVYRVLSR